MAVFIVFYLLNGMSGQHIDPQFRLDISSWQLLCQVGMNSISGLFMIYCFLIFQEQQKFPVTLAATFALQVILDSVLSVLTLFAPEAANSSAAVFMSISMDVLMLVFVT